MSSKDLEMKLWIGIFFSSLLYYLLNPNTELAEGGLLLGPGMFCFVLFRRSFYKNPFL